jgi:amidase
MGVQIVAPIHSEASCLAAAAAYETVAGEIPGKMPPLV